MKTDLRLVYWLRLNALPKKVLEAFIAGLGDWLVTDGESFGEMAQTVRGKREAEKLLLEGLESVSGLVLGGWGHLGIVRIEILDGQSKIGA